MVKLRTGYTTGTCAAGAARAALLAMTGHIPKNIPVRLPRGDTIDIPVQECSLTDGGAVCSVIKDGGDDPDVTHGASIVVELFRTEKAGDIIIEGGEGVGVVTKPGLGLEVGGPAINPVPCNMIRNNILEVCSDIMEESGMRVVVSVPSGKDLAPKTDNPRLGILGGISILGTSGIVVPFSTASFAASIRQSIDVIVAMDDDTVVLTTGGRSEAFAQNVISLPDHCFVQVGDFSGYAVRQCSKKGIRRMHVAGFVGKLAKMAAGVEQTHVKGSKVDMSMLSGVAEHCGADASLVRDIRKANTARQVLEMVSNGKVAGFCDHICGMVRQQMEERAGDMDLDVIMFDFDGAVVGRAPLKG